MAGLMCAQRLLEWKIDCIILEDRFCGSGATGKSSGFITPDSELGLSDLLTSVGSGEAKRLWDFATGGVRAIEQTIIRYGIACDHQVQDSLFVASSAKKADVVYAEHKAHQQLGYPSEHYSSDALPAVLGSRSYHGAVRAPDTFGICAYLYCQALKDALAAGGIRIYEGTPAKRIEEGRVQTDHFVIKADKVIVCTDRFLPELGIIPKEIYHAQTFLAVSKPLVDSDVARLFPDKPLMVWDTNLIYQYYRLIGGRRLLLGASSLVQTYCPREKHNPRRILCKMEAYLTKIFPDLNVELEYLWPGMIGVSKDFLPLAGKHPQFKHTYFIGGAAGLPWAAALGYYMADKLAECRDDLDSHFTPYRPFPIGHGIQAALRKPVSFALSHGVKKYFK
jgi:gamma-glutamylputrescine oxidase